MKAKFCSIPGCGRKHDARGWCHMHYIRWYKTGDPNGFLDREVKPWQDRFWPRVEVGDCWLWTAGLSDQGYGHFYAEGKVRYAHRWLWQALIGPIPDGLTLDHLCQVRRCVNPDHLEPVTLQENIQRAVHVNSRRAFCRKGHPLTWIGDQRGCLICRREYNTAYNRRWRAA